MRTLNRYRASYFIARHCTAIQNDLHALAEKKNFAGLLQAIVNHLRILHAQKQFAEINSYINHLGCVYNKGNSYVRDMIENLFVRSLGSLKRRSSAEDWIFVYDHLPKPFARVYDRQIFEDLH